MRWIRVAERVGAGVALAAVVLALGLAQHSRAPAQAGSAPGDSFATVTLAQPGAGTGVAEGMSYRSLGRVAQSGIGGNWVSSLPLVREIFIAGHSVGRQPLGWTTGPLFSALHVPLVGRAFTEHDFSAQLDGSTEREMVLTRDAANTWFGSVDAALGKTVELEPVGFGAAASDHVAFVVVGVAKSEFIGPSPDRAVSGWVPLGAWPDVVMPRAQGAVIGQLRPEYLGIETRAGVVSAAAEINADFAQQASALHATLSRGLGLTAQRRATLDVWSQLLLLNAMSVGGVFAAMYLSSRFVQLLREQMSDAIRNALGESRLVRATRRIASELRSISALILLAIAAMLLAWFLAPRVPQFPLRESIAALSSGALSAALLAFLVLAVGFAPLFLSSLALGVPTLQRARRNLGAIKASNLVLIGLSFAAVVLAVGAAGITFVRMNALLARDLGFASQGTWYAEVERKASGESQFPSLLDGRPIAALVDDAAVNGPGASIALASAPPVGAPQVVSASVGDEPAGSELVAINFVTPSYFRILGIPVEQLCAPMGEHSAQQVIVNQAFLRRYASGNGALPTRITAQVPSAGRPQELSVCGVAGDAQFLNARGPAVPVIYAPLARLGNLGAIIGRGEQAAAVARLTGALQGVAPEYEAKPARAVADRISEDLQPDKALAALSLLISLVVVVLSASMCLLTLTAAAAMLESEVAVRWSMGSSRMRLTTSLLSTRKPWPILASVMLNVGAVLGAFALAPELPKAAVLAAVGAAFVAAASCALVGVVVVARRFNDRTMARVLNV